MAAMTDEPRARVPVIRRVRRHLRIGVGGLMLVILLIALWLGDRVHRARMQRLAVAAVKAAGGHVCYTDEFALGPVNIPQGNAMWQPSWGKLTPGKGPWAPDWLRRRIGDEYFREIAHVGTFVDIRKGLATAPNGDNPPIDTALLALRGQAGVRTLQLGGDTISDRGMAAVASLTGLQEFFLWWGGGITDAGVAHLGRLPHLKLVDITLAPLTDAAVGHLADLPALESLSLQGQKFTDRSLKHLTRARRLKSLMLRMKESEIGDAGLRHLEGLKALEQLTLENTPISPTARERLLKAIPNLKMSP